MALYFEYRGGSGLGETLSRTHAEQPSTLLFTLWQIVLGAGLPPEFGRSACVFGDILSNLACDVGSGVFGFPRLGC